MKKLCMLLALIGMAGFTMAQDQPASQKTREFYLRKAKTNNTIGWAFMGAGVVVIAATAIDQGNNKSSTPSDGIRLDLDFDEYAYAAGGVLIAGSIPFFIMGSRNREKADAITTFFRMENSRQMYTAARLRTVSYPALGIKFSIR